jgi:hypothetical protein
MKNQKLLSALNLLAWVLLFGLLIYILWSKKGCNAQKDMEDYNKVENIKTRLTQAGPFLFWRGDTLDVHTVEAGFMQYYAPKKYIYTETEAFNTIFECFEAERKYSISFKLQRIKAPPSTYELPEKMLILGGEASNFEGFKTALIGNGVVDKALNWTFGKGHLVITSAPMYANGSNNEFLYWLLYKLEQEAENAGGKVHIVFGQDPFRKLKKEDRQPSRYRPDFFKIQDWDNDTVFQKNSEIGRWLHSKNVVENIGGYLILESGLSEDLIDGVALDTINNAFRTAYLTLKQGNYGEFYLNDAQQKRLLKPQNYRESYRFTDVVFGNIFYTIGKTDKHYNTNDSDKRVDRLLNLYKARHIIGRFPHFRGNITTANNHKYIGDIPDVSKHDSGSISTNDIRYKGVWIEKNQLFVVDDEGKKTLLFEE